MKDWKTVLTESSLSRIKSKVDKHSAGCITAFRGDKGITKAMNKAKNKELFSALKAKGYSITKVKGSWIEDSGGENPREVGEETWFVANHEIDGDDGGKLENHLKALGKKFEQESILSIREGVGYLIGTSKKDSAYPSFGVKEKVGKGKYGKKSGDFFSRIRGREFAFESVENLEPNTRNGKWAMDVMGKRIWDEIATEGKYNQKDYKFFLISSSGKIHSGWEFKEDAKDAQDETPKAGKILTAIGVKQLGLDVNTDSDWEEGK